MSEEVAPEVAPEIADRWKILWNEAHAAMDGNRDDMWDFVAAKLITLQMVAADLVEQPFGQLNERSFYRLRELVELDRRTHVR